MHIHFDPRAHNRNQLRAFRRLVRQPRHWLLRLLGA